MKIKSCYPIIVVDDIEASKAFYCDKLGFTVKHEVERKIGGKVLVLANDLGIEIEMMQAVSEGPVQFAKGPYGFRVNVDDIEAAREELVAGGKYEASPIFETGVGKNFIAEDNSGVHITFVEHIKK